jgi:hypothetical protein
VTAGRTWREASDGGPLPIMAEQARLGEVRFPSTLQTRQQAPGHAISALFEHAFIFLILVGHSLLFPFPHGDRPRQALGDALTGMIDRKDFTQRVEAGRNDEIGMLADGVELPGRAARAVHRRDERHGAH